VLSGWKIGALAELPKILIKINKAFPFLCSALIGDMVIGCYWLKFRYGQPRSKISAHRISGKMFRE